MDRSFPTPPRPRSETPAAGVDVPAAEPAPVRTRRGRRGLVFYLVRASQVLGILYGVLLLALLFGQGWLIFPGRFTQGQGFTVVRPPEGTELVPLTTRSGERIVALFAPALTPEGLPHPKAARCPTILYTYGNGSWLSSVLPQVQDFRRLGANMIVPEYVGYGMSSGSPSEAGCYASADAAYEYLLTRKDIDPGRIVAVGGSLGGAVAIDLASRKPVAGLATFCTFTCLEEMAQRHYPFVPSSFLHHRFKSEEKIRRIHCPTLLGHGTDDSLIPSGMMDRLAAAAGGPVTHFLVEDAGHNDFFSTGGDEVLRPLGQFLNRIR
jgi:uncharacterized protein